MNVSFVQKYKEMFDNPLEYQTKKVFNNLTLSQNARQSHGPLKESKNQSFWDKVNKTKDESEERKKRYKIDLKNKESIKKIVSI